MFERTACVRCCSRARKSVWAMNGTDETANGMNVVTNVECLKEICVGG